MSVAPVRRRRRIVRRVLLGLLVVVIVALVGGYWYARPLLMTGTGYAAHNACAVTFVAGRQDPRSDLPPNPLVPYLSTEASGSEASSSIKGLLSSQKAWYTPGLGCTLGKDKGEYGTITQVPDGKNPYTSVPTPVMDAKTKAAVDRAFGDDLSAADKATLGTRGIVVLRGGTLVAERYADGFDSRTPQLGWSMTKSVASLLTGIAVEQGKVALSDKGLFPEWTDGRKDITVENLLRMDSGIQWDETYDLGTPITRMLYLEPSMAGYVSSLPLAHPVGTVQQYSSGSTNLLCSVLQNRFGHADDAPADFPRAELFAPLELSSAVLEPDGTGLPVCSSYLWATPRDWAAIGQFALQDGEWDGDQLLPADWMTQSVKVTAHESSDEESYGLGWRSNTDASGQVVEPLMPADAYWMSGHDGQRVVVVPSADLVVVRLGFSPAADDIRVNQLVGDLASMPIGG